MPKDFFNSAVQLAGLGASGVCVFSLLCSVWLLWKSSATNDTHTKRTILWFMGMCFLMTVVIAISGFMNNKISGSRLPAVEKELRELKAKHDELINVSQIQERNLERFRERQDEYEANFNNTVAGFKAAIPLVKKIPVLGESTAAGLEEFLRVTTPRTVQAIPYSLPEKSAK